MSGSYADTVRRGIARKKPEILAEAMPKILDGYCSKSDKPREVAEQECQEFLKIIEDASAYMFGYNHSIAYCLLGYLCGYLRYYHPGEYITAFLNNAANDDDLANGAMLAKLYGFKITMPKYGISDSNYSFDAETKTIAKGISSIKGLGEKDAGELLEVAKRQRHGRFSDVIRDIRENTHVNSGKLDILIHIDFFDMFGNQRELENIVQIYDRFADRKQISRDEVEGSRFEEIIRAHSTDVTKAGKPAARYTISDPFEIIHECEDRIMNLHLPDFSLLTKVRYFAEVMGYSGFTTGKDEDMKKLYVKEIYPLNRKKDGKQFGYSVVTQSIGSGKETRFTHFNREYNYLPISKGDIIRLIEWHRDKGMYFTLDQYAVLHESEMSEIKELA